ncbi:MAG: hypothetical protein MUE57_01740 [Syntrophales bacterium]|nr:hypothetical protein [Syntrophales bacterium]
MAVSRPTVPTAKAPSGMPRLRRASSLAAFAAAKGTKSTPLWIVTNVSAGAMPTRR